LKTIKKQYFNLGMIRIQESCPAAKVNRLLNKRLKKFGLDLEKDVCAGTGDGAAVMKKFDSDSCIEYSICLNHTIHLAVIDVVFPRKNQTQNECSSDTDGENSLSEDSEAEWSESQESESFEEILSEDEADGDIREISECFTESLVKMRKVVKIFKFSSVKNNVLRRMMEKEDIKPRNLVLDCKTRWNSLEQSISVFLSCLSSIIKALRHLKINSPIFWLDVDTRCQEVRVTFNLLVRS
jgi:hypothetical protein